MMLRLLSSMVLAATVAMVMVLMMMMMPIQCAFTVSVERYKNSLNKKLLWY